MSVIAQAPGLALSPGPSQILSHGHREKSGEGLGAKLRHRPEMVEQWHAAATRHSYTPTYPFLTGLQTLLELLLDIQFGLLT